MPTMPAPSFDETIILRHDKSCRHRARIELLVVRRLIADLITAGYALTVDDGDGIRQTGTPDELISTIFGVDEAHILADKIDNHAWVFLVLGNDGWDVISDYAVSLESVMAPLNQWIDEQESLGV